MITFARTRWSYDSYTDFWKLVELSGYPICYVDEMDLGDKSQLYIMAPMNGELSPYIDDYRAKQGSVQAQIYLWNLERPSGSGGLNNYANDNERHKSGGYIHKTIVSDPELAITNSFVYVPMGGHPELGEPGTLDNKEYDLIHLACFSYRRGFMFHTPSDPKAILGTFSVARNCWGNERHKCLKASRIMLNIHQDEDKFIEPLRFVLAAAYGLPIVSEHTSKSIYDEFIVHTPLHGMFNTMRNILDDYPSYYMHVGLPFREYLNNNNFRTLLEGHI